MLELVGLVLAAPGAIVALYQLRALHRLARARVRPRVAELDFSVRFSIRLK